MNRIIRAFAAFIVSICLILAPAVSYAASSWNVTNVVSSGSRVVVSATKAGYKSAVNIAPTAGRLALTIAKRSNQIYFAYAVIGLIGDGVDWSMDAENNRVKYKPKSTTPSPELAYYWIDSTEGIHPNLRSAMDFACSFQQESTYDSHVMNGAGTYATVTCVQGAYGTAGGGVTRGQPNVEPSPDVPYKYLSMSSIASQVIKNANSGHAPSKEITAQTATEMVITGQFDGDLLAGAVPTNDTKPLVPSVPISGNGNQGYGGVGANDGADGGMSGATPGEQAASAAEAAEAARQAAAAAAAATQAAADAAQAAADNAADVINSGSDAAAVAAAQAAAAAATQAAADAKAVSDAAVAAANDRAAAAEQAAAAATQAAQSAATQAASDLAAAKAAGNASAIAAAESASAAAAKELASAKEKQAAAEKAAEKAKAEAAKPFELPAFCSWASKVCDFVDWVKEAPILPDVPDEKPEIQDIDKYDNIELNRGYITATGECPPSADLNINFGVVKLSYEPLCIILEKLSGVIVAVAYISAGFMIVRTV